MPNFRRNFVPGATYFFTIVTYHRRRILTSNLGRELLRQVFKECKARFPFEMPAIVLLPDHVHAIWTLPPGDDAYPKRLGFLKKEFTKNYLAQGGTEMEITTAQRNAGRRGVLQPR